MPTDPHVHHFVFTKSSVPRRESEMQEVGDEKEDTNGINPCAAMRPCRRRIMHVI